LNIYRHNSKDGYAPWSDANWWLPIVHLAYGTLKHVSA
jgi:hypothetical protein